MRTRRGNPEHVTLLVAEKRLLGCVLDHIRVGIIVFDRWGHPIELNKAALRMLEAGDGLRMDRGRLTASDRVETLRLRFAMRRLSERLPGTPAPEALVIHRGEDQRPYQLIAVPLTSRQPPHRETRREIVVFISDGALGCGAHAEVLMRLYGLTRAESRLALALVQGKTLQEAAQEFAIALNTARTHLKRIFVKTNTGRQPELVAFLASSLVLLDF